MYLVMTGLAAAVAAVGAVSVRKPRAIPVRVRSKRSIRVIRRD
jgi:hypothetical protein